MILVVEISVIRLFFNRWQPEFCPTRMTPNNQGSVRLVCLFSRLSWIGVRISEAIIMF